LIILYRIVCVVMSRTDTETNCKTNRVGNGYRGTKAVAMSGYSCINWTLVEDVALFASSSWSVNDITQSRNYCRRLAKSAWDTVTCFTAADNLPQIEEQCDVGFCGR